MHPTRPPTVSVIIPTYNRAHLVGRAIRSVLAQTYQDWECLVVDDGSTDNTEEVVRSFGDPRILYLRNRREKGAPGARNTGIETARGEYLAFLDSDDEWLPKKLERQLYVFQSSPLDRVGVILCGIMFAGSTGQKPIMPTSRGWLSQELLEGRSFSFTPTFLIKRSVWSGLFDTGFPAHEDWDYLLQASFHGQIDYIPEILVWVDRTSDGRVSLNDARRAEGIERFVAKYAMLLRHHPRVLARHHEAAAFRWYRAQHFGRARRQLLLALRHDLRNPRPAAWLLGSMFGRIGFHSALKLFPRSR